MDERQVMLFSRTLKSTLLAATAIGHHGSVCLGRLRTFAAQLPPRLVVPEEEIEESFLKGSGPGGQKIVRFPTSNHQDLPANAKYEDRTKRLLPCN